MFAKALVLACLAPLILHLAAHNSKVDSAADVTDVTVTKDGEITADHTQNSLSLLPCCELLSQPAALAACVNATKYVCLCVSVSLCLCVPVSRTRTNPPLPPRKFITHIPPPQPAARPTSMPATQPLRRTLQTQPLLLHNAPTPPHMAVVVVVVVVGVVVVVVYKDPLSPSPSSAGPHGTCIPGRRTRYLCRCVCVCVCVCGLVMCACLSSSLCVY